MAALRHRWTRGLLSRVTALACAAVVAGCEARPHVVFRVTIAHDSLTHGAPVSGRLIVLMSSRPPAAGERLAPALDPELTWIAAREVRGLAPGRAVEIDADSLAAPRGFSRDRGGRRWVMAVLDVNHDANWALYSAGDLVSELDSVDALGTRSAPTPLALTTHFAPPRLPVDSTGATTALELPSPLLSAFWRRPVTIRAAVIAPPAAEAIRTAAGARFRAVYHMAGWGGSYLGAFSEGRAEVDSMRAAGERGAVHVFLDPSFATGDPEFANSAVNGPWADALIREVIPYLEGRFHLISDPRARFLTGHSSGGWSSLWLQVSYPEVFGGAWATSPDPVDFRDFMGVDVRPGSRDNLYRTAGGSPRQAVRDGGDEVATMEETVRQEQVLGPGGQTASYEAVFGPRAPGGAAIPLFDRATGRQNPAVQRAWAAYDIRGILQRRWPELGPRLRGKLHLLVGDRDTFHLDGSVRHLCAFLRSAGSDATCEIVPGRNHFDLYDPAPAYPRGLHYRFGVEMQRAFDASWRKAGKSGRG